MSCDHRIVTAKIRLSLQRKAVRTTTTVHYDWSLLNNKDIRDEYTLTLRNEFDVLQQISEKLTQNDECENFVNAHIEAAAECISTKKRINFRVPWETLTVRKKPADVKKRADMKIASLGIRRNPNNINSQKLKKTQNELTNVYLKEQTEYIQNQINKIRDSVEQSGIA